MNVIQITTCCFFVVRDNFPLPYGRGNILFLFFDHFFGVISVIALVLLNYPPE